ncbi:tetratricopeptide repeat protein [Streptomyces sp. NBC_00448]|uniref:tetratricopeptide repeat protein n=1 Tax=Streptomyces sp. NBC_00448 TaxID=2903652 RepID=UPI002E20C097
MLDPLSVSAVTTFLGSVGAGAAGESGRRLCEAVGGVVARVAGREVTAPADAAAREALAAVLVDQARSDPERARALGTWMSGAPTDPRPDRRHVPHTLPASVRFFTDRKGPLAALDREAFRKADGRPRIAVLYGPEGVGTSALALHWGGLQAHRYPDGTLYADLRAGSTSTAPTATALLRHFLLKLHVPQERVPPAAQDRAELFRALLADRRLLVVLDHARTAAQVVPLVTAAPGVFTVVVARRPLTGLDARPVLVDPLGDKDAKRLLVDLVGKQTVAAARATLPSVLERCAGSPFALRAAATDLAGAATAPPAAGGDPVRTVVDGLYRRLAAPAARVYRLAALRAWPALDPGPVAAAAGIGEPEARDLLAELAQHGLLEPAPDGRYRFRPAVRAHAADAAAREDGVAACAAALRRAIEWYVSFAVRADHAALPQRWHVGPRYDRLGADGVSGADGGDGADGGALAGRYDDEGAAIAALTAEADNIVEAVLAAEEFDDPAAVCEGAEALWALQLKAGCYDTVLPALRAGVRAAPAYRGDPRMAGRMHTQLALALIESAGYEEAGRELAAAARAEETAGHLRGRATAVETLGLLRLREWRFAEALSCFEQAGLLLARIGPDDDGREDVPRATALVERHQGRALRGLGRFEEARQRLDTALAYFEQTTDEPYNAARVLTDLAETDLMAGDAPAALPLIDRAAALLGAQHATVHLDYLAALRLRCRPEQP